ncbi:hypothetical protein ACGFMK_36360 [Amycolatopsis sp. NPDC049252]|uniref:hypothetical protein n=1 Tax=Amycolatopsis sp. NPDC049252 TaxID=3363933 RepID=UPI0037109BF0
MLQVLRETGYTVDIMGRRPRDRVRCRREPVTAFALPFCARWPAEAAAGCRPQE